MITREYDFPHAPNPTEDVTTCAREGIYQVAGKIIIFKYLVARLSLPSRRCVYNNNNNNV